MTPYVDKVHEKLIRLLSNNGICVDKDRSINLGINDDYKVSSMTRQDIMKIVDDLVVDHCRVVGLICSAMRCTGYGFIDELEKKYPNVTFITSSQAILWKSLHMVHNNDNRANIKNIKGYGKLFRESSI